MITLVMLNILCTTLLPNFYPVNLQHSNCEHVFSVGVGNSVDPDQKPDDLDLQCFLRVKQDKG